MATRFVNVDRKTPMLPPPDLRDWVPEDDLVHFVIEAMEAADKAENEEGRKLPRQIARREALKDKIEKARKKLEEQAG